MCAAVPAAMRSMAVREPAVTSTVCASAVEVELRPAMTCCPAGTSPSQGVAPTSTPSTVTRRTSGVVEWTTTWPWTASGASFTSMLAVPSGLTSTFATKGWKPALVTLTSRDPTGTRMSGCTGDGPIARPSTTTSAPASASRSVTQPVLPAISFMRLARRAFSTGPSLGPKLFCVSL